MVVSARRSTGLLLQHVVYDKHRAGVHAFNAQGLLLSTVGSQIGEAAYFRVHRSCFRFPLDLAEHTTHESRCGMFHVNVKAPAPPSPLLRSSSPSPPPAFHALCLYSKTGSKHTTGKHTKTRTPITETCSQFIRLVCPPAEQLGFAEELGFLLDQVPGLDDACGAGTSASLDPSAVDYVTMIEDAVLLLQDDANLSIPAAEIDAVCQVPVARI